MFANYCNSENEIPGNDNNNTFNIWTDVPDISPTRGWNILSKNRWSNWVPEPFSPVKKHYKCTQTCRTPENPKKQRQPIPAWQTPEKVYKYTDSKQWKKPGRKWRAPKKDKCLLDDCDEDDFFDGCNSLDNSPRTSTPVHELFEARPGDFSPFEGDCAPSGLFGNGYRCWKDHLQTSAPGNKLKVRGALFPDEFVSGHFIMRQHEKKQYIENHSVPVLNRCFVNLLINGPSPLICDSTAHEDNINHWKSKCFCLPNCRCTSINRKERVTLPIGYQYDDNGLIVPTTATVSNKIQKRNPLCIYTN